MHMPDKSPTPADFLDPLAHAIVILETVEGDYRMALEHVPVWAAVYGVEYAMQLENFLTPKGEC